MSEKKLTKKRLKQLERRATNKQFKVWTLTAKKFWDNKCAICGSTKMVNIHHLVPREIHELRFHQMNAIALCPKCHKFSNVISAHKNPFVFFIWFRDKYPDRFIQLENLTRKLRLSNGIGFEEEEN